MSGLIRRIGKHKIEGRLIPEERQHLIDPLLENSNPFLQSESLRIFENQTDGFGVFFDKHHGIRSAGKSLQSQCAGARKKVEDPGLGKPHLETVQPRLAQSLGCGPGGDSRQGFDEATPMDP